MRKSILTGIIAGCLFCFWFWLGCEKLTAGQGMGPGPGLPVASGGGESYLFKYDADHSSGDYYAYTNSGSGSIQATTTTGSISQTQYHSSPDSWLFDDTGEINFTTGVSSVVTAAELDECSIEIWIYIDEASQSSEVFLFEVYPNSTPYTDIVRAQVESSGYVYFRYEANNVTVALTTTGTVPTQQWVRLRFRITTSGDSIGVQIGTGSWENDSDGDAVGTLTANPDRINLAEPTIANGYTSTDSYKDDFSVISGYNTWND